jgi:putative ribosome biogenesis GTPase RsgA
MEISTKRDWLIVATPGFSRIDLAVMTTFQDFSGYFRPPSGLPDHT